MADTLTNNLLLTKPEIGGSADTWGTKLNVNMDAIDAIFAANGGGMPASPDAVAALGSEAGPGFSNSAA